MSIYYPSGIWISAVYHSLMKLRISLPAEEVGFLDAYPRSQGIRTRSGVVQAALRLLRTSQLADDYASAWTECAEEDAGAWDRRIG